MHYHDPFDLARSLAGKTDPLVTKYRHGAVILDRKGRIIGRGVNHFRGRIIQIENEGLLNKTVHAEIHALERVNIRRLEDAVVISYARTDAHTILGKPCPNCWTILKRLGFKKVFYTDNSSIETPVWVEEHF